MRGPGITRQTQPEYFLGAGQKKARGLCENSFFWYNKALPCTNESPSGKGRSWMNKVWVPGSATSSQWGCLIGGGKSRKERQNCTRVFKKRYRKVEELPRTDHDGHVEQGFFSGDRFPGVLIDRLHLLFTGVHGRDSPHPGPSCPDKAPAGIRGIKGIIGHL